MDQQMGNQLNFMFLFLFFIFTLLKFIFIIKAFQWVIDNIGAFGGDNQNITISGQSAGASSVGCNIF
jgi:hypothetical protein